MNCLLTMSKGTWLRVTQYRRTQDIVKVSLTLLTAVTKFYKQIYNLVVNQCTKISRSFDPCREMQLRQCVSFRAISNNFIHARPSTFMPTSHLSPRGWGLSNSGPKSDSKSVIRALLLLFSWMLIKRRIFNVKWTNLSQFPYVLSGVGYFYVVAFFVVECLLEKYTEHNNGSPTKSNSCDPFNLSDWNICDLLNLMFLICFANARISRRE